MHWLGFLMSTVLSKRQESLIYLLQTEVNHKQEGFHWSQNTHLRLRSTSDQAQAQFVCKWNMPAGVIIDVPSLNRDTTVFCSSSVAMQKDGVRWTSERIFDMELPVDQLEEQSDNLLRVSVNALLPTTLSYVCVIHLEGLVRYHPSKETEASVYVPAPTCTSAFPNLEVMRHDEFVRGESFPIPVGSVKNVFGLALTGERVMSVTVALGLLSSLLFCL